MQQRKYLGNFQVYHYYFQEYVWWACAYIVICMHTTCLRQKLDQIHFCSSMFAFEYCIQNFNTLRQCINIEINWTHIRHCERKSLCFFVVKTLVQLKARSLVQFLSLLFLSSHEIQFPLYLAILNIPMFVQCVVCVHFVSTYSIIVDFVW